VCGCNEHQGIDLYGHAYFVFSLGRKLDRVDTVPSVAGVQINQSGCGSLGPEMVVLFVQFTPGIALFDFFFLSFGFLIYSY
jgi:L-cystine uptake protein TcyP (sodium:dicarboxylate symporter family)